MKKREKILLQILICIALFAAVWMFFLEPAMEKRDELKVEQQIVEKQKKKMDRLINTSNLNTEKEKETQRAEQNYQFFYSVLNSYTIDEILTNLATANGLKIQSLQIGQYEEADGDFRTTAISEEDAKALLRCQAEIIVTGNYDNILLFIDGMNAKSSCLRTEVLSIRQNQQDVSGSNTNTAQIQVVVYGISTMEEK